MSVLYKCPYCRCFFATKEDLQNHALKLHGQKVAGVKLFDIREEARVRVKARVVWRYRFKGWGRCELCGDDGEIFNVGLHDGRVVARCKGWLEGLMWKFVGVKFEEAKPKESLREGCSCRWL